MTDKELFKHIWLAELSGAGSGTAEKLSARFGGACGAWDARNSAELKQMVGKKAAAALDVLNDRVMDIINACLDGGYTPITSESEYYPPLLRPLPAAPVVLYASGRLEALTKRSVSGVGSRRMTVYGKQAAAEIFRPLARSGISLVSGLAFGVDAEVHKAAINEGGWTVAVMGNPINETYPAPHAELRRVIEHTGAVISEYPPVKAEYSRSVFPLRNRIIAGMSEITAVIECGLRSGTMSTVGWATRYGREVYAVPGRITDETSAGCNRIIADGASVLLSAGDIALKMGVKLRTGESEQAETLAGKAKEVYLRLYAAPSTEDELSGDLGLAGGEVLALLAELELGGFITRRDGRYEVLKNI